jgi:hypothetical protein
MVAAFANFAALDMSAWLGDSSWYLPRRGRAEHVPKHVPGLLEKVGEANRRLIARGRCHAVVHELHAHQDAEVGFGRQVPRAAFQTRLAAKSDPLLFFRAVAAGKRALSAACADERGVERRVRLTAREAAQGAESRERPLDRTVAGEAPQVPLGAHDVRRLWGRRPHRYVHVVAQFAAVCAGLSACRRPT